MRRLVMVRHGVIVLVALLLLGCASKGRTTFTESSWMVGPDGEIYENSYKAEGYTKAGLFGEVPEAVHDIQAKWGDVESTLSVGQVGTYDNSGQIEVAGMASQMMGAMVQSVMQLMAQNPELLAGLAAPSPSSPERTRANPDLVAILEGMRTLSSRLDEVESR